MKWSQFIGQDSSHINSEINLHKDVVPHFYALKEVLSHEGIDLALVSGFRSFEKQKQIWSEKATGKRAILDDMSHLVDISELDEWELCQAILRFSALPGLSRHHWGTDFDVYDKAALSEDYQIQLTPHEYSDNGIFFKLANCLKKIPYKGFKNPYKKDLGGIHPEPWHLSYTPIAENYRELWDAERYFKFLQTHPFPLSETILENLDEVIERFWI